MPSPNALKEYAADTYYHVYNRGVAKQQIFHDDNDYSVFLSLLKTALTNKKNRRIKNESKATKAIMRRSDVSDEISLLAYCLLPNHFHLLLYSKEPRGMEHLMRSVSAGYVKHFNRKYQRVGPLFQGRYKASRIFSERHAMHISRYIHLNALDVGKKVDQYSYSSFGAYTGSKNLDWVDVANGLHLIDMNQAQYRKFVMDWIKNKKDLKEARKKIEEELKI